MHNNVQDTVLHAQTVRLSFVLLLTASCGPAKRCERRERLAMELGVRSKRAFFASNRRRRVFAPPRDRGGKSDNYHPHDRSRPRSCRLINTQYQFILLVSFPYDLIDTDVRANNRSAIRTGADERELLRDKRCDEVGKNKKNVRPERHTG